MYMRQSGVGGYKRTGNWAWEFYPPPYDFLAPSNSAPMPAPVIAPHGVSGVGCACGGQCGHCHAAGMGLFDSGLDLSQWGAAEWFVSAGVVYLALSLLGDIGRVKRNVTKSRRQRKATRRRKLEAELDSL